MTTFTNANALIYGAAKGIGRAVAQEFARRGARVAVADIDLASAQEAAGLIDAAGGHAPPSVAPATPVAVEETPPPAAVDVAEVAIGTPVGAPIGDTSVDGDWQITMFPPMGAPQEMTGHFATAGTALSGYLESPEGRQDFAGSCEAGKVKFELKVEKPMKITLKYDLTVTGDAIAGKVKLGLLGSAKLTGTRIG